MTNGSVAEMKPRLKRLTSTLREKAGRHPDSGWADLYDHWIYLWNNPEEFEGGGAFDQIKDQDALALFELGVAFGVDYEQAYPEGGHGDWPVPVSERPEELQNE